MLMERVRVLCRHKLPLNDILYLIWHALNDGLRCCYNQTSQTVCLLDLAEPFFFTVIFVVLHMSTHSTHVECVYVCNFH